MYPATIAIASVARDALTLHGMTTLALGLRYLVLPQAYVAVMSDAFAGASDQVVQSIGTIGTFV
jgi:hypothetical protein